MDAAGPHGLTRTLRPESQPRTHQNHVLLDSQLGLVWILFYYCRFQVCLTLWVIPEEDPAIRM